MDLCPLRREQLRKVPQLADILDFRDSILKDIECLYELIDETKKEFGVPLKEKETVKEQEFTETEYSEILVEISL